MQLLSLNTKAEVAFHGQMADMEWTLERTCDNPDDTHNWLMTVHGVVDVKTGYKEERLFKLTDKQASATLALIIP